MFSIQIKFIGPTLFSTIIYTRFIPIFSFTFYDILTVNFNANKKHYENLLRNTPKLL